MLVVWNILTPRGVIAGTVVAGLVAATAVGSLGVQSYLHAREDAESRMLEAVATAAETERSLDAVLVVAAERLAAAELLLTESEARTLDSSARDELRVALERASSLRDRLVRLASGLDGRVAAAQAAFAEQLWWPPTAEETAAALDDDTSGLVRALESALDALSTRAEAVTVAVAAWQAEQDRLAAEAARAAEEEAARQAAEAAKAAAEAAERAAAAAAERQAQPRTIPSTSTLTPTGGATAPSAPPPPPAPAPVVVGFSPEAYLAGFADPSQYVVQYVPGLCSGYYVCGRTIVGGGLPVIQLDSDPAVMEIYSTDIGKYVLVHEAAHARQFVFYGSILAMITESERFAAESGRTGVNAVEYMADCATIVRLGYALQGMPFPYTGSCTAAQYAEAQRIW